VKVEKKLFSLLSSLEDEVGITQRKSLSIHFLASSSFSVFRGVFSVMKFQARKTRKKQKESFGGDRFLR
jgi:hypothetical protein